MAQASACVWSFYIWRSDLGLHGERNAGVVSRNCADVGQDSTGAESAGAHQPKATPWVRRSILFARPEGERGIDHQAQSFAKNLIHLVFSTSNREPVLVAPLRAPLSASANPG